MSGSFDEVIHAPLRLRVCAMLASVDELEYALVREQTGVSESVLTKHCKQLEAAGYVSFRKSVFEGRNKTWLSLTSAGKRAFAGHVEALTAMLNQA